MSSPSDNRRGWRIAEWTLCILLAAQYLFAGGPKLLRVPQAVEGFHKAGYPLGFLLFIGLCETSGAMGLLIPRLRFWAASGLMCIMLGALYTHQHMGDPAPKMIPAALSLVLLGLVAWATRPGRGGRSTLAADGSAPAASSPERR